MKSTVEPMVARHADFDMSAIRIRTAQGPEDFEQLHRLNYMVFSQETGQYAQHPSVRLVDKFHDKNHYVVADKGGEIVGMICAHWTPPYSVVAKWPDFFQRFQTCAPVAEIRLLAVSQPYRRTPVAWRLMHYLACDLISRGIVTVVISGIAQQRRSYEKLGFKTVGLPVMSGEALFYPMVLTKADFIAGPYRLARCMPGADAICSLPVSTERGGRD